MGIFPNAQPSEQSEAGDAARRLAQLLGPVVQPAEGTAIACELYALGQALADALGTSQRALDQAFADAATVMLPELERSVGLPVRPDLTDAERQARLVAKVRQARGAQPARISRAARALTGGLAATAVVFESSVASIQSVGGPADRVYLWALVIPASIYTQPQLLAAITALLEAMKPAHTKFNVGTRFGFRTDDPDSLTDRDVLSA